MPYPAYKIVLIQNVALLAVGLISAAHQAIFRLFLSHDGLLPQTTAILVRVKFTCRIGRKYFGRRTSIRISLKRKVTFY